MFHPHNGSLIYGKRRGRWYAFNDDAKRLPSGSFWKHKSYDSLNTLLGVNDTYLSYFQNSTVGILDHQGYESPALDTTINYINGVFYAADTTADTYEWISCFDGHVVASGPDPFFEPQVRTWVYLKITKDLCEYTSGCMIANDVGLEEFATQLEVYPNPAQDHFTVDWQGQETLNLELYSSQGSLVRNFEFGQGKHRVQTPAVPGVYYLRASDHPNFNLKLTLN